ncbi:MAG: hypothetical protein FK732_04695, partial [Asgard group archaeon]|nr:hypothetical protein [Asgard group archaeon]
MSKSKFGKKSMGDNNKAHRLYPRPLSIAKLIAPIKYKRNIVRAIEDLGQLEPIKVDPRTGADQISVEDRRNEFETLRTKFNSYISSINSDLVKHNGKVPVANNEQDVLKYVRDINEKEGEAAKAIIERQDQISSRIAELQNVIKLLERLESLDVSTGIIADTAHTKTFLGIIFPPQMHRLLWLVDEISSGRHFILDKEVSEEESIVLISVLREDAEAIQMKLNSLNFQSITIPQDMDLDGLSPSDCYREIGELEEERKQLLKQLDSFSAESGSTLLAAHEVCNIELQRIEVELQMRRTETTCILWTWLPESLKEDFRTEMHGATNGSATVDFRKGDFDPEFTPSYVSNSEFMKPMRGLVTSFGTPSMNEIDPYPFVKYLFPILFGIMFADFGHGLILLLIGLWAKRKKDKMAEIPKGISGYI